MEQLSHVNCPFCSKILDRLGQLDGRGVWGKTPDSPSIQSDDRGDFMVCSHCQRQVRMERVPTPVGAGFRVADRQK